MDFFDGVNLPDSLDFFAGLPRFAVFVNSTAID